jgi:hypothetical protein
MTKRKSMRGQNVDTDLIRMKHQLASGKKTESTIKREDYISDRRRRSSSKRIDEMLMNEQVVRQKIAAQKLERAEQAAQQPEVVEVETPVENINDLMPEDFHDEVESDETPTPTAPQGRKIRKQG